MKKFVARNVAEVGRNSTAAILCVTVSGMDKRFNLAIARNIAPCIRALIPVNDKREKLLKQLEEKRTIYTFQA